MRRLIEAIAVLDTSDYFTILDSRKASSQTALAANFAHVKMLTPCHHRVERLTLGLEIARLRLDLLHSPDFIPPLFGARRTVITIHDLNFLHYPQFQTPDSRRYYNGNIQAAVRKADHILADSQATKADLCHLLRVPAERITVHPLGVDPMFQLLSAEVIANARARLSLPAEYLLFVGTFEPRKNLSGLLNAYAQLRTRLPDAPPLVIAGRRGWLYESIFALVESLGLSAHVLWRENIAASDLPALYNGALLLALPSFYEGFGLTALEAMACGVPVVAADRASLPEVVGSAGILIDPDRVESLADGLYSALTDSALREHCRREGLARSATFTWQRTAEIALSVYQRVLAN